LSHGLNRAGFSVKLAIENDKHCVKTLRANNKGLTVIEEDIRGLDPQSVMDGVGLPRKGVFLVFNGGLFFENILKTGTDLGYNVQWKEVNAEDFGVPQRRRRVIVVGTLYKTGDLLRSPKNCPTTVKYAIDDLPVLANGNTVNKLGYSKNHDLSSYQRRMRHGNRVYTSNNLVTKNSDLVLKRYEYIPQGGNWEDIPTHLMRNYKDRTRCHPPVMAEEIAKRLLNARGTFSDAGRKI
jgi:DNA (cytosine-5)-methyltransferase 1